MITSYYGYRLKPIMISAATAHTKGIITYDDSGTVFFCHPQLEKGELYIPPSRQFPAVRATFDDLNKALSSLANSPIVEGQLTLRQSYEQEVAHYETLVEQAMREGRWEPDYGTYVLDHRAEELHLIAPERWHRLSLVTSNSKLACDPDAQLSWLKIRERLESAVVGFAGLSVGGNLLEGWLREARPKQVKIADPDWLELTNFNRCERASLRHLVGSRADRFDPRNPYETLRVPKAEYTAYEQNLIDPYVQFFTYQEPLSHKNIDRFLLGDGDEPAIDILVEEVDDLDLKLDLRHAARENGVDVLMLTDFGHRTQVLWNPFAENRGATLGAGGNDEQLTDALIATKTGDRNTFFSFIDLMCRFDYQGDPFENFARGEGEHPTSSVPQSGATTMIAGGIGGKELMLRLLGHTRTTGTQGVIYDFVDRRVWFT